MSIHIGRPSNLYNVEEIDWAPTLKLGQNKSSHTAINVDIQQPSEQLTTEKINEQQITEDIVDNRPQEHEEGACTNHA